MQSDATTELQGSCCCVPALYEGFDSDHLCSHTHSVMFGFNFNISSHGVLYLRAKFMQHDSIETDRLLSIVS